MKLQKIVTTEIDIPEYLKALSPLTQGFLSQMLPSKQAYDNLINPVRIDFNQEILKVSSQFLLDAIENKEKIMICGDYDCDGIISTTLILRLCRKLGLEMGFYIPNRLTEGYGTKPHTIELAAQKGYQRVIMVDNGVKCEEALLICHQHQIKTLVIDHHTLSQQVSCDVLYHPSLLSEEFHGMCSSGQILALAKYMGLSDDYMDVLGGIATIADMMELTGFNRHLVVDSIAKLNSIKFMNIDKLLKRSVTVWDEEVIAFQLVPVFNAIGRLSDRGNVNQVVKYLLCDDLDSINRLSNQLLEINQLRKILTTQHTQQAIPLVNDDPFQIIVHDQFHEGIIGIVAGQLVSIMHKPVMVLCQKENILKGSVRSNGLDVYDFLKQFEEKYFLSFGGHQQACALSLRVEDIDQFKKDVQLAMKEVVVQEPTRRVLVFRPEDYKIDFYHELMSFRPFGQGFKLCDVLIDIVVYKVQPLGKSGYKLEILPIGDIKEVLYFKKDLIFDASNFTCQVIGKLTKGFQNQLQVVADSLILV